MINRGNWLHTKDYLEYRRKVDQITNGSYRLEKTYIRYLLEWAQETPFSKAPAVRPTYPEYLLTARLDGTQEQLSAVSIKKSLATARRFFIWLHDHAPGYSSIRPAWSKTLKAKRLGDRDMNVSTVTFDEILDISHAPTETVQDRRIQAAAVFWYLSGIRIGAFVSLPLKAVDIKNGVVKQFPEWGVRTKNNRRAETALLPIPELLELVQAWDDEVRAILSNSGFWFAHLLATTGKIDPNPQGVGKHRHNLARRNLKTWLAKVGLPYKNPHAFRHGHIYWGMTRVKDLAEFKAVSENVMHSNVQITDRVYSKLSASDLRESIRMLGKDDTGKYGNKEEIIDLLEAAINSLRNKK